MKPLIHQTIFYGSYIAIPVSIFLLYIILKKWRLLLARKTLFIFIIISLLGSLLFIYSRFIEPNVILTKTTKIETGFSAKVVVISDLHLGVYKSNGFLKKLVDKINKIENVDFVLIPGDFTYYPPEDLESLFSPIKGIRYPVYAVLGNHDSEKPGLPIQKKLQLALKHNGVVFLHNTSSNIENKNITILGLGDKWAKQDDISKIREFTEKDNLIVITHNPDTSFKYENSIPDLTVAGHTHGGQIRIPYIYKKKIPSAYGFDEGLYETKNGKVFVSAGVGIIGLPFRLLIPPRIDVLELQ